MPLHREAIVPSQFSLVVFAVQLGAQARHAEPARGQAAIEQLHLTPAQVAQLRPVVEAGQAERDAIVRSSGIAPGAGRPAWAQLLAMRRPLRESLARTEDQVSEILTSAQVALLQDILEEHRAEIRSRAQ